MDRISEETYEHHFPKAPEGTEAAGKATSESKRREQRKAAKRAAEEAQGAPTTPPSDIQEQPQSENKQRVPPG